MKHLQLKIIGKVQGVYFRANTREVATNLGVTGEVRNEKDGSVSICAEGEQEQLDTFLDWCRKGPVRARVDSVEVLEGDVKGYKEFLIAG